MQQISTAFGNLSNCRQDLASSYYPSAGSLALFPQYGPGWTPSRNLPALQQRVQQAITSFPEGYQRAFQNSFFCFMNDTGTMTKMVVSIVQNYQDDIKKEKRVAPEIIFTDLALAILSRGALDEWSKEAGKIRKVTRAYQEIISDLHHQWFKRAGISPRFSAAIVKFGPVGSDPYTWTIHDIQAVYQDLRKNLSNLTPSELSTLDQAVNRWTVPTISFSSRNLYGGLLDLASFGHEDVGHNVVHSVDGLAEEIAGKIRERFKSLDPQMQSLGEYWAQRVDETTSDVMGILHGGPAIALAFVVSLRGKDSLLFSTDDLEERIDEHPIDVLRAYLAQYAIRSFTTSNRQQYITQLDKIINSSLQGNSIKISMEGKSDFSISKQQGSDSARLVVDVILNARLSALGNRSLSSIRQWNEQDQRIAGLIQEKMRVGEFKNQVSQSKGEFAFHAVAASITEAMDSRPYHDQTGMKKINRVFQHTIEILEIMHQNNPLWSPLQSSSRSIVYSDTDYTPGCQCVLI